MLFFEESLTENGMCTFRKILTCLDVSALNRPSLTESHRIKVQCPLERDENHLCDVEREFGSD